MLLNKKRVSAFMLPLTLLFSLPTYALEDGGTSSNGGGGAYTQHFNWRSVGPSLLDRIESSKSESIMNGLIKKYPDEPSTSCSNGRHIIAAPASLRDKIVIEAKQTRSFWQWLKREAPRISNFSFQQLCENDGLYNAYSHLMSSLYNASSDDRVSRELILKSFEKSGVVHFQLEESAQTFEARGGTLVENTWFEHVTGVIHWGPFKTRTGMDLFLQRQPLSYLRHELTHVLLLRSLGARYPKETVWHDVRFQTKDNQVQDHFAELSTSENAAFIEGIAGAFEAGLNLNHPYVVNFGSFSGFTFFNDQQKYCTWHPEAITRDRNGMITAPLKSEAYIGSALNEFVRETHVAVKDELETPGLLGSINESRLLDLIQVIATESPTSIETLALGYEKLKNDAFATRWYREYFFKDLSTLQTIEANLVTVQNDSGYLLSHQFTHAYCYTGDVDLLLTPFKKAQQDAEYKAEVSRRNQSLKDKVAADVHEVLRVEKGMIQEMAEHTMSLEMADAKQKALSLRVSHQCQKSKEYDFNWDHSMIDIRDLYDKIQTQYPYARRNLSWAGIFGQLKNGCRAGKTILSKYQEFTLLAEEAQTIMSSSDEDRVSKWIQLRAKIRQISNEILITQAIVALIQ